MNEGINRRKRRVYLNIGALPFFDNQSGIPRVAKELTEQGLSQKDIEYLPVYPDPISGRYRIAVCWCRERGWALNMESNPCQDFCCDPEIDVKRNDWLIHTMINYNELVFNEAYISSFRKKGAFVGAILYDIIAEEHPEYFRARDAKLFSQWLREIPKLDKIFTISKEAL